MSRSDDRAELAPKVHNRRKKEVGMYQKAEEKTWFRMAGPGTTFGHGRSHVESRTEDVERRWSVEAKVNVEMIA
jgi:hypothetical protein